VSAHYQCVVCGVVLYKSTPHREDTTLRDHRDATHPEIKKSIPLSDLFRPHPDPRKATP